MYPSGSGQVSRFAQVALVETVPASADARHRDRIRILVEIAAQNASSISIEEILDLLPQDAFHSTHGLRRFIDTDARLSAQLSAIGNEVTLRGQERLATNRQVQRILARDRLAEADSFLHSLLRICPWIELAGVSGSTAYSGAKPGDDIDFFIVTQGHRLWATLLLGLALARITRSRSGRGSVYCFNRLIEWPSCERTFFSNRDPLFAREALNLRVLHGQAIYGSLLRSAPWMASHFHRLYDSRLADILGGTADPRPARWGIGALFNAGAFLVLAPYLTLMGFVRNVRLKRSGREKECFRTVVRSDFWATESAIFDELRDEYRRVFA